MDIITSTICSAQDKDSTEDFSVSDIVGGLKMVNGVEVPMTQEDAQAQFIKKEEMVSEIEEFVDENTEIVSIARKRSLSY